MLHQCSVCKLRIVMCGGGTGGHVYPALSIAEAIDEISPGAEIHFIGMGNSFESRAVASAGRLFHEINAGALIGKSFFEKLVGLWRAVSGTLQAMLLLRKLKPGVVIGTGGYVMAPVIAAAKLMSIPFILQEQNSFPGYATRKFARFACFVCLGNQEAERHLQGSRVVVTGNPVRRAILKSANTLEQSRGSDHSSALLVLGGSLGARSINTAVANCIDELAGVLPVYWQTGRNASHSLFDSQVLERLIQHKFVVRRDFFDDMDSQYARAKLVVCRAGAITLAELALFGLPAVLVPFPYAAHQHQLANARSVENEGGAVVIPDSELTGEKLFDVVQSLLSDSKRLSSMSSAMKRLAKPSASWDIAKIALKVAAR